MRMPKISVRALKAFIAVYEEQSFSKAADRENATQSGMSTQVKNLEMRIGADLLIRSRKRFDLTPAGKIVYTEGQAILRHLLKAEKMVEDLQGDVSGSVRFGIIPTLTRAVLPLSIERFGAQFPGVELSLLEEYSGSLLRRVIDGELDFAVVPAGNLPPGTHATFIGRDREMILSRPGRFPDHAHLSDVPLSLLAGARLIVPSPQNVRRGRIEAALSAHGVHVADLLEMDGMLATVEMIGTTDWVAILPSAICHPDIRGTMRELHVLSHPPMTIDYNIVQKSEGPLSRAARLLADRITADTSEIVSAVPGVQSIGIREVGYSNK
jgi:DNA-binding transcriptional LysR family regulator